MSESDRRISGLDLSIFTPYRIAIVARAMSEQLGAAYAGEDVTIPEWRVLAVVGQAASVAARDVATRTPMDKMAVSRAVATLEAKGLIVREPTSDRRVLVLRLSAKGKNVCERISELALAYETAVLGELTGAERAAFISALSKLESAVSSAAQKSEEPQAAE